MTSASLTVAILTASDRMLARPGATPSASHVELDEAATIVLRVGNYQIGNWPAATSPRWERTWRNEEIGQRLGIAALPAEHRISCRLAGLSWATVR